MKKGRGRYIFCGVMLAAVFLLYIGRLAQWQLLEGSTFEEEAVQSSATYLKLTGTRGKFWTVTETCSQATAPCIMPYTVVFPAAMKRAMPSFWRL